jgi:hypothetical protein
MLSKAVTADARHQRSPRSVRSLICARVFAGTSVTCVILSVLAARRLRHASHDPDRAAVGVTVGCGSLLTNL